MRKKQTHSGPEDAPLSDLNDARRAGSKNELRKRAEERAGEGGAETRATLSPQESQRLLHQLEVHQIELEMQNEELRQVRAELEAALGRHIELYDFAPAGYLTLKPDGAILQANLTAARLLGIERSRLLNRRFGVFAAAEARAAFHAFLTRAFETKTPEAGEVRLAIEGQPPLTVQLLACVSADGRECRLVLTDFTERNRAEEALRASEERFRLAAETSNDVVYEWDLKQRVQWFGKIDEMLGYGPGEFPRTLDDWALSVHPEDRERVMAAVQARLEERAPYAAEYRVRRKDGVYRWWSARGAVARTPDGKPVRWIGTITDITERKAHEREIERLTRLYATLNQVNQSIVRIQSREELFHEACRIAVEYGGFDLAWIGRPNRETRQVLPVARAGDREGYLDKIEVYADDRTEGRGPVDSCLREGKPCICNDVANDPRAHPWRDQAVAHGLRAVAALPIRFSGEVGAAFTVYAAEAGVFQDKEIALLEETALDISYALDHLEQQERRQRAEEATRESERFVRATLDGLTAHIAVLDEQGAILAVNEAWRSFAARNGLPREQACEGVNYLEVCEQGSGAQAENAGPVAAAIREVLQGRRAGFEIEYACHSPEEQRWFIARATPFPGQHPRRVVIAHENITRRKRDEIEIRASEQRFRDVVRSLVGWAWEVDERGRYTYASDKVAEILGYAPNEILGRTQFDLMPVEEAGRVAEIFGELAAHRWNIVNLENWNLDKAGNRVCLLTNGVPLVDDDGALKGYRGVDMDITARKIAEQQLRASEANLQLTLDAAHLGDWSWNITTGEVAWSARCKALYGFPPETLMSYERFLRCVHPEDRARIDAALRRAVENRADYEVENRVIWPDDSIHWTATRGRVFCDGAGQPVLMAGVTLDITQRKRAEEALRQLNAELEERVSQRTAQLEAANTELEAFSYSVSHDLRAPLRHVGGFIKLLESHLSLQLDDESRRYIHHISGATRDMQRLIESLLTFSRMGRTEIQWSEVDMQEVVQAAITHLQSEAGQRPIQWEIGSLPRVRGDRDLLRLVWVNLLSNAIKYTRGRVPAQIVIAGNERGGEARDTQPGAAACSPGAAPEWIFSVRDNGAGFDMEFAGQLFGVFQRLHRQEEFEGVGIGLANVQRIIARHGGRAWGEGKVNAGATFYFSLPKEA